MGVAILGRPGQGARPPRPEGATTLGETAGDLFSQTLELGYFLSTSMAGTTLSDFMNRDASSKFLSAGVTALGWGPQGLGIGYPAGATILTSLLVVLAVLMKVRSVPNVLLFWLAFVLTRPLGATVGDFFTKPAAKGGLGLGTYGASAVLLAVLVGLMVVMSRRQSAAKAAPAGEPELITSA